MVSTGPEETAASELEPLLTAQQIAVRVAEMGVRISADYEPEPVLLVGVLKGAAIFLADLARSLHLEASYDFLAASSYGQGTRSSGVVRLIKDLSEDISSRHVIVVEDILDTGLTLNYLCRLLRERHPKSLRTAVLLDKPSRRQVPFKADYVGFTIPDEFVVGYGLDFQERYRNLPGVYRLGGSIAKV